MVFPTKKNMSRLCSHTQIRSRSSGRREPLTKAIVTYSEALQSQVGAVWEHHRGIKAGGALGLFLFIVIVWAWSRYQGVAKKNKMYPVPFLYLPTGNLFLSSAMAPEQNKFQQWAPDARYAAMEQNFSVEIVDDKWLTRTCQSVGLVLWFTIRFKTVCIWESLKCGS